MARPRRHTIMERNNIKTQIVQRLVVYAAAALLIYGGFAYFRSPCAQNLAQRKETGINFLVLTQQPMFISYNPKAKKAVVSIINPSKKNPTLEDVLKEASISTDDFMFLEPSTKSRTQFWDSFKDNLHQWKQKPYIVFFYIYDYIKLRKDKKTDICAADFIALSYELTSLAPADFSVINKEPQKTPAKKRKQEAAPAQPQITLAEDIITPQEEKKTIVIEILNASGKSGVAAEVTRYLRDLNNRGTLNLDVINYSNFPTVQPETQIINHSGNLEDLKNISLYLNLGDKEIFSKTDKIAISDAKIILGQDFTLPKTLNK